MTANADDPWECNLSDAWWHLASTEQRGLYQQTESDSRRHSHRIDMHCDAVERVASGEYEAWGHWVCGTAPPAFQKIEPVVFRHLHLYDGQNSIDVGSGKYELVVLRKSQAQSDPTPSVEMVRETAPQISIPASKNVATSNPMKRGAKPKYKYTKPVLDEWYREEPNALKQSAKQLHPEYQERFRRHYPKGQFAPVGERQFHEYLKQYRNERGIRVDEQD